MNAAGKPLALPEGDTAGNNVPVTGVALHQQDIQTGSRGKILNIPNGISFFRLSLLPVMLYYLCRPEAADRIIAFAFMLFIGFLDIIDGFIARRLNMISEYGKAIDSIIDKIIVDVIALFLIFQRSFPVWYAALIWARDISIILFAVFLFRERKLIIPSNRLGKYSNAVLVLCVGVYTLDLTQPIKMFFVLSGMIMIVLSAIAYLNLFVRIFSRFAHSEL